MTLDIALKYILWVCIGGLLVSKLSTRRHIDVLGNRRERWSIPALLLFLAPLIYWCGTRSFGFGDTYAYKTMYLDAPSSLSGVVAFANTYSKDQFFYGSAAVIKCLITENPRTYFLIIAAFQLLCLGFIYRKYSRNLWISIFLFVASTDYIVWMFNGMRQFLAATICFTALPFIVKKKYIPAILLILLGSLMHKTALLLLPVTFIVQGKAWNKKTLLIILGTVLAVAFVGEFTSLLDSMLQETQYENVVTDWTEGKDDGTNTLRVLIYAVPTVIALIYKRTIQDSDNTLINICVNMSIISTAVYVVSMFTSGIFIGRLPIYMSLYNYILLPWELRHCFQKSSRLFVTASMCLIYFLFYCYSYM
ncbi:MAG: EpsG family protein [Oscillospiraceae bacterium]|nr:EpsG family protein [Oscillospiraceae bacterium]